MAHLCPWWLAYTFDNRLRRLIHIPEKVLSPYIRPGMTVMDVGCGMGHFSLGMAGLVGDDGMVISVDLQEEMLEVVQRRAEKAGVDNRIRTYRCTNERIGDHKNVNFALAFWMVNEVQEPNLFFEQIRCCLTNKGMLLVAEPKFHVSAKHFKELTNGAENARLRLCEEPLVRFSRAAL
ncbi:MAG: class I SAM-dependent methyltransferase, partial [Desulfobacterales bacterium]|nr:class I SAM-dependent methyltransferase [Desulfobacterales bacterium]